jgi:hypothetical protein
MRSYVASYFSQNFLPTLNTLSTLSRPGFMRFFSERPTLSIYPLYPEHSEHFCIFCNFMVMNMP